MSFIPCHSWALGVCSVLLSGYFFLASCRSFLGSLLHHAGHLWDPYLLHGAVTWPVLQSGATRSLEDKPSL